MDNFLDMALFRDLESFCIQCLDLLLTSAHQNIFFVIMVTIESADSVRKGKRKTDLPEPVIYLRTKVNMDSRRFSYMSFDSMNDAVVIISFAEMEGCLCPVF